MKSPSRLPGTRVLWTKHQRASNLFGLIPAHSRWHLAACWRLLANQQKKTSAFCRQCIQNWRPSAIGAIRTLRNRTKKRKKKNQQRPGGEKTPRVTLKRNLGAERRTGAQAVSSRLRAGKRAGGSRKRKNQNSWRPRLRRATV